MLDMKSEDTVTLTKYHTSANKQTKTSVAQKLHSFNQDFSNLMFAYLRRHWYLLLIIGFLVYLLARANTEKQLIIDRDYPNERVKSMLFPQKIIEQQYLDKLELKDVFIENAETITRESVPHLLGTLVNHNEFEVHSVVIEVHFYWNKNDPMTKFDTRYVNIAAISGTGAFSFKEIVGRLNIPEDEPYEITYQVVAATD